MNIKDLDENGQIQWSVCQICGKKIEERMFKRHKVCHKS